MELIDSGNRKASKDYTCDFCGGEIKKGDKYNYQNVKDDTLYTWRTHAHCDELVDMLDMHEYANDGVSCDVFYEAVKEEFDNKFSLEETAKLLYDKLKETK